MNRVIWRKYRINKDRKWWQFWKPEFIEEQYYLKVEDGYVVIGDKND